MIEVQSDWLPHAQKASMSPIMVPSWFGRPAQDPGPLMVRGEKAF